MPRGSKCKELPVQIGQDVKMTGFMLRFGAVAVGLFLLCAGCSLLAPTTMAPPPSLQDHMMKALAVSPRFLGSTVNETLESNATNTTSSVDVPTVSETVQSDDNATSSEDVPKVKETLQSDANATSSVDASTVNEPIQSDSNVSSSVDAPTVNKTVQSDANATSSVDVAKVNETLQSNGFRNIIDPQTLPPFWLMAILLPLQVIVQFMIFGFDVKTEKEGTPNPLWESIKSGLKIGFSILMTLMALNSMRRDVVEFVEACSADDSFLKALAKMLVLLGTSTNLKAAAPFFAALTLQNPSAALSNDNHTLKPKYPVLFTQVPTLEISGGGLVGEAAVDTNQIMRMLQVLPATPFATKWMPWYKWCYMVVLLPYWCVIYLLAVPMVVTLCPARWLCCASSFCLVKNAFLCCLWLVLTAASLGFWAHARDELSSYWHFVWPFWCFLIGYQLVNAFTVAATYLTIAFFRSQSGLPTSGGGMRDDVRIGDELLKCQNQEDLKADWEFTEGEVTAMALVQRVMLRPRGREEEQPDPDKVNLEVIATWKTNVLVKTLEFLVAFVIMSVFFTATVRAMFNVNSDEGIVKAWSDTLTERTIRSYALYLYSSFHEGKALFSEKVNLIWNLI